MDDLKQSGFVNHVTPTVSSRAPVKRKQGGDPRRNRHGEPRRQHPHQGPDEDHQIDEYA